MQDIKKWSVTFDDTEVDVYNLKEDYKEFDNKGSKEYWDAVTIHQKDLKESLLQLARPACMYMKKLNSTHNEITRVERFLTEYHLKGVPFTFEIDKVSSISWKVHEESKKGRLFISYYEDHVQEETCFSSANQHIRFKYIKHLPQFLKEYKKHLESFFIIQD